MLFVVSAQPTVAIYTVSLTTEWLLQAAERLRIPISLVRLMLRSPAFWLDSQAAPSGFGTPWELASISDFFVVSKGGNLPGYATVFSLVPRLNVTVVMAINTDADDFAWLQIIHSLLLPALNASLVAEQRDPPAIPGPRYKDVVGTYTATMAGHNISVTVTMPLLPPPRFTARALELAIFQDGQVVTSGFLDYVSQTAFPDQLLFRFSYPAWLDPTSCFDQDLAALQGSYFVFTATADQKANTVTSYYYVGVVCARSLNEEAIAATANIRVPAPVFNAEASMALLRLKGAIFNERHRAENSFGHHQTAAPVSL